MILGELADYYGQLLDEGKVGPVELATISFGQRFEVTPIQMITMVSSIANDGVYVTPIFFTKVVDSNGETVLTPKQEKVFKEVSKSKNIIKYALEEPTLNEIFVAKVGESYEK